MFFASKDYDGKPGTWEPFHNEADLTPEYMFKTALEIDPIEVDGVEGLPKKGVPHRYRGAFMIDLDTNKKKGLNSVEEVREVAVRVLSNLVTKAGLDPSGHGIRIYYSGSKGYHIEMDQALFGMDRSQFYLGLPYIYKNVVTKMGFSGYVDMSIYSSGWGRLWRRPNIQRSNGKHKIPLSYDELCNLDSSKHAQMAMSPRMEAPRINGVQTNTMLSKLFKESYSADKVRRSVGLTHRDFKELLPASFNESDCISKILNNHPAVSKSANFHHMSFILCTYFVNMGHPYSQVERHVESWIKAIQSQSYPAEAIRWAHFKSNFDQVSEGGYRFSCGAARNLVDVTYCATCPLNKNPDWTANQATGGVIEWENAYQTGILDKATGEWVLDAKSNGIFIPTAVGISQDGVPNQQFNCEIRYTDHTKSPQLSLDFLEFTSEEALTKHVQKVNGIGGNIWSPFALSKKALQGIRLIVGNRMKNLPHYLSTGATHGAFKFKGEWVWADNEGGRDKNWVQTGNAMCDQPYSEGSDDSYFKQHLTAYEPYDKSKREDMREAIHALQLIQVINSPHIMYLTMGWLVASFFRPRFFDLKSKTPNPNVHTFPLLFHIGKAQTGKTTLDNEVLIPISGYGTESLPKNDSSLVNIKLFALSCFSLFMHISKASNGCPIFLDEFKDEFSKDSNGSVKFTRKDMDTLCRLSYDRSVFTRGTASLGMETNTISSTFKINTPKLGLNSLDQASYQRSIMVYADERMSQQYTANFKRFYKFKSGKPILQRIGATIAKMVLGITDERLIKALDKANKLAVKLFPTGGPRRQEGLSKIIFGNMVIASLFSDRAWNFPKASKVCAAAYAYMDEGPDASKHMDEGEDFGMKELAELISSDGKGGRSDWNVFMGEILDLTSIRSEREKLANGSEYFFKKAEGLPTDYYFVLKVKDAISKLGSYSRQSGTGSGIIMSDADFRIGAKVARILVKYPDGNDFSPFEQPEEGGRLERGQFVRLSVTKMLDAGFQLKGIPGSEDALFEIERDRKK